MALEAGQRISDYEVLALLGSGGMGRVYKVRSVISNREEAMKVLLPDFASEPDLAARFMAEIRTLAGLEHPNIAQLRTAFQFENQLVMVMEFVEGTTLEKLSTESRIPFDQVLDYSTQVLSALSYAHARGVTHRDIKPANIMVTSHGLVKLMDFGIAKSTNDLQLTRPGTTMGSIYYMSPEQVRGGTVDARSDIYSFGVTLYEMLTGRKPFQADTSYSVLNAQLNEAPMPPVQVNPALPPRMNDIVLRAMAKQPEARFQTADEFRDALKSLRQPSAAVEPVSQPMAGVPGFAPVPASASDPAAARNSGKSHRGLWIGLGAAVALLALAAVATLVPHFLATHGSQKISTSDSQTPASSPAAQAAPQQTDTASNASQPANPLTTATPAVNSTAPVTTQPNGSTNSSSQSGTTARKPREPYVSGAQAPVVNSTVNTPSASSTPAGPSPQEVRQAHDRLMNLNARADAANSGVQQIRSQQQAQGLDIRGDVLASMSRMNNYLGEANRALDQNDLQTANDYMERADKEISRLESFLGR